MLISYSWLREYVKHSLSPAELAHLLTMAGLEEESTEKTGPDLNGLVVGHVLECGQHPNADRLSLCTVDTGESEPLQIVCGAPNVAAGQWVPVALVGTTLMLPDRENPAARTPFTIRKSKIRGEISQGMICSAMELGLSDDHSGILVLDKTFAAPGRPFSEYLEQSGSTVNDWVIDVAITPNRPDAVSHIGVARDVAALSGLPLQIPEIPVSRISDQGTAGFSVQIECPDVCRRYVGVLVEGVTVGESPEWLKQRLKAVGLRPRNNVVDVTNYVMYECGQPLHGFDFDRLADRRIVVRQLEAPAEFVTLDDKKRTLPAGTMMICDGTGPVAVAGVMGGENSEVASKTTNILIESAWFDPSRIRKTAREMDLSTDASYRFERGVDSDGQVWAAMRAADLIREIAGGTISEKIVDCHPNPVQPVSVVVRPERVCSLIGTEIATDEMERMLSALGFGTARDGENLLCTVPSFRPDVTREVDVTEEILRMFGFDNVPSPPFSRTPFTVANRPFADQLRLSTLNHLKGVGFREIYNNSLLSREVAEQFLEANLAGSELIDTLNPVSLEMAVLRPSLLPGTLKTIAHNQNHGLATLRTMEFGHVFARSSDEQQIIPGYGERDTLLLAWAGEASEPDWSSAPREADFFDLKGIVEILLASMNLERIWMRPVEKPAAFDAYAIKFGTGKAELGKIAALSSAVGDQYRLRSPLYYAEFDWEAVSVRARRKSKRSYSSIQKDPAVLRDLAVVVHRETPAVTLLESIQAAGGNLIKDVRIFDVYEGRHIPEDKKSLAFSLKIGADRTLVDAEIDRLVDRVVQRLASEHNAELRGA